MRVRAKRAGWDQRDGLVLENDILDPPAWVDDGLDENLEGELVERWFIAPWGTIHQCLVDGQEADPATIEKLEGDDEAVSQGRPDRTDDE
jgi:hypothetical protein